MKKEDGELLLSPSDIAELAGVNRPVVSNWRKRYADFPFRAGGTEAKPLFASLEVEKWLTKRGHKMKKREPGARLGVALNALRDRVSYQEAASFVLLLATLKKADPKGFQVLAAEQPARQFKAVKSAAHEVRQVWGFKYLKDPAPGIADLKEEAALIIEAVVGIDESDLAAAVDTVLERLARLRIKVGAWSGFVGSRTSDMLVALAGRATGTVYDPACGIANVLIRVGEKNKSVRLVGSDIWVESLETAEQRAFLRDIKLEVTEANLLESDPHPDLKADVIVAEPPFNMSWDPSAVLTDPRFKFGVPSRMSSDLAWVQHAVAHLSDRGRAYVLTAPNSVARSGSERQIRTGLLASGCVQAIVTLPPRMLPQTTIGPVLWVLRPEGKCKEVLFIDATTAESPETDIARWISDAADNPANVEVPHSIVPNQEILAADADLNPGRWISEAPIDKQELISSLANAFAELSKAIQGLAKSDIPSINSTKYGEAKILTIRELAANRIVDYRSSRFAPSRELEDFESANRVTAENVRSRNLPTTERKSKQRDDQELTEPGDVLVSAAYKIDAVVDEDGGHVLGSGVERLRVLDQSVLMAEYLAIAITGAWNERFKKGLVGFSIREVEIPLIPLAEQAKVVALSHQLEGISRDSARVMAAAGDVKSSILAALRYQADLA